MKINNYFYILIFVKFKFFKDEYVHLNLTKLKIFFRKSKKPAFIDEVSNYLNFIEEINSADKETKYKINSDNDSSFNNIQLGNFEKDVNK